MITDIYVITHYITLHSYFLFYDTIFLSMYFTNLNFPLHIVHSIWNVIRICYQVKLLKQTPFMPKCITTMLSTNEEPLPSKYDKRTSRSVS